MTNIKSVGKKKWWDRFIWKSLKRARSTKCKSCSLQPYYGT